MSRTTPETVVTPTRKLLSTVTYERYATVVVYSHLHLINIFFRHLSASIGAADAPIGASVNAALVKVVSITAQQLANCASTTQMTSCHVTDTIWTALSRSTDCLSSMSPLMGVQPDSGSTDPGAGVTRVAHRTCGCCLRSRVATRVSSNL